MIRIRRSRGLLLPLSTAFLFVAGGGYVPPAAAAGGAPPSIHPGAVELGLAGNATRTGSLTRATLSLTVGRFHALPSGLADWEAEIAYTHASELHRLDGCAHARWTRRWQRSPVHPFLGLWGGIRQEWVGSFDQTRYPLGLSAGARLLVQGRAAVRFEYRLGRVTGDTVADFTEHQFLLGVSILFRNRP